MIWARKLQMARVVISSNVDWQEIASLSKLLLSSQPRNAKTTSETHELTNRMREMNE